MAKDLHFYYYTEDTNSRYIPKLENANIKSIAELAKQNQIPTDKAIQRLAFRGEHSRRENIFYFILKECYPTTIKCINCCLIFNRYCVIYVDGLKLHLTNFNCRDYNILQAILKERKAEYIDRKQREENVIKYLLSCGYDIRDIRRFGIDAPIFEKAMCKYHTFQKVSDYSTVMKSLAYYYDIPLTLPTERDPLEQWANIQPTTYASHDLIEEYYLIDENGKPHRIEEVHSTPTEIYYKPKQVLNPVEAQTLKLTFITYLENGFAFNKPKSSKHPLPSIIEINGKYIDIESLYLDDGMTISLRENDDFTGWDYEDETPETKTYIFKL